MIILSGVLVVVAIALLVAGIVAGNGDSAEVFNLDALFVIYISIAVSIVSALCLAIGVFLRRKEIFPGAAAAPARKTRKTAKKDKRKKPAPAASTASAKGAPATTAPAADPADDEAEIPAPPADVPDDALVFVVRGRKRYHLDTCRQLAGRETEELTYAEAKEEGFSPCTACMPDTALAARAAASAPASPDASRAGRDGAPPPKPGAARPEGGLAGLAKPAPTPAPTPTSFDRTAEIPRPEPADEPERPAPGPAGPTLTDMPVASIFTPGKPAEPEPEAPAPEEEPAEPASRSADIAPDPEPASDDAAPEADTAPEAAAPKPRDADDEDAPAPQPAPDADDDEGPQVRILSGTKRYHRTDCALIEDIGDEADDLESLSRGEAKSRGCTPCLVCQPDREHARD
ncbi:hypothetical protein [Actinomadura livida]|uniref:Uncharacterized protein n=1 Tax=Actinomadura livida TaxID=79909 RepID=A0A7W7IG40_9ACTN|nr:MULTISPECIES: hypothetical protein [Actinomadura]MBB4776339.1 hypothetical protein [Actinomadura catellatispora]GGU32547.1 hypothetical protein GCM10010208_66500 [Actinomadura livida]